MSNGSNLPKTWTQFIDIIDQDKIVRDTMREASKAKEIGARAPAVLYLRAMADAGDAYFEALPEPWSDQATKKHGDGTDVDLESVEKWSGDPRRYWDNYSYEVSGQLVTGSTFLDMVNRTEDGKSYLEFARLCAEWNKDGDKTNLTPIYTFNGQQYDLENMPHGRRNDMKQMADGRRYNSRDNLRILVQIWRNMRDINKLFSGIAEVDFIYEAAPDADGNMILERIKKPIEVYKLVTLKESPRFGQREGSSYFSCTSLQFANLAPNKCAAMENGLTFENLKRLRRKVAKAGAGATTQEDANKIDVRITSNNFSVVLGKMAAFAEDTSNSRAAWLNLLVHAETDARETDIAAAVELYNFLGSCIDAEWVKIYNRITATQADRKAADLAAKLAESAATKEAEAQPSQHQRNAADAARDAARQDAGEDVDAARTRAESANKKPSFGKTKTGGTSGKTRTA